MKIDIEHLNATFPKIPPTMQAKGWTYGVWYTGKRYQKQIMYGTYPGNFLARALALFPEAKDILHCPSGTLNGDTPGITVDLMREYPRAPQVQACASSLPFRDNSFDLYLSDPPYSPEDSKIYGCPPYPIGKAMREASRVLRPNGYFGMLHVYYPSYRRSDWQLEGLIAVVTGFMSKTRMFSIFRNKKPPLFEKI